MGIDILLATHNGETFLKEQIDSILAQTEKQTEKISRLIIRDDASTDGSFKILRAYEKMHPEKIVILDSSQKLGIKANFSALMSQSTAKYILFADQDDIWEAEKVCVLLKKMKELESLHSAKCPLLVHSDLKVISSKGKLVSPSFWKYAGLKPSRGKTLNRLLTQNVVTGCAMMINRPLLKLSFPIPQNAVMHDWWLALIASAKGKIGEIDTPTVQYRQHGKNAVGAKKLYSLEYFKRGIKRLKEKDRFRELQAEELLKFSEDLSLEQKRMIDAFRTLSEKSYFKQIYTIFKFRFFRMGFLRNIVGIFLKA